MIGFSLWLLVFNEAVATPPAVVQPALQQQLQQVSELRTEELAELRAAAQVRKLQHELKVAQLRNQISALVEPDLGVKNSVQELEHPLAALELLSVVRSGEQVSVWLQRAQQRFSVQPNTTNAHNLQVQLQRNRLTLVKGPHERTFYLQGEW
ncbi:hypothetical protein ACQ5ES_04545 [Pseudidiomarina sp. E22-M8]|uniref:hypothetical protein n=1 Tax=Pseudidiomarina sp. E22-M8 TaxID=3424768 RepID=UPI00403C6535